MKIDQIVFSERKVPRFLCCEMTTDTSVLLAKSVICSGTQKPERRNSHDGKHKSQLWHMGGQTMNKVSFSIKDSRKRMMLGCRTEARMRISFTASSLSFAASTREKAHTQHHPLLTTTHFSLCFLLRMSTVFIA